MNMFNSTMGMGMGMGMGMQGMGMYGGNFIDMLFRHCMEKGWESITLVAIFELYMYLSLDRLKDLFKYANDKMGEYGKKYLESYGTDIINNSSTYYVTMMDYLKRILLRDIPKPIIIEQKKKPNTIIVSLNSKNKTDLMALGNFLLRNKEKNNSQDYKRDNSDKYKSTELYEIPELLTFDTKSLKENGLDPVLKGINLSQDIIMKITQNVECKLVTETDCKFEILRDVTLKVPDKDYINETSSSEFDSMYKRALPSYESFSFSLPDFQPQALGRWHSCPSNFLAGNYKHILIYIYYTKNFGLFKQFYKFIAGEGSFWFNKKNYKLNSSIFSDSGNLAKLKGSEKMDSFISELETYCDKLFIPENKSDDCDKWVASCHHLFESVTNEIPCIKITFESEEMSEDTLSAYSRFFMNSLVTEYYHQNIDRIGNKISIYQLNVKYNITMKKKENPKFIEWEHKYGEAEKKENEEKEKKAAEQKEKEKGDDKEKGDKPKESRPAPPPYSYYYGGRAKGEYGYTYRPIKPEKFIEEEMKTPEAECIHIKSDRKPFEYLYLEKSQKDQLESYLSNFKNNRELYDKMGITYKSGIILNGSPGNGKSSSIVAIATYLNKDIYYLDLGKLRTNDELKLCIDYVKINSQRGGIIIFEDIDVMSDICKKRSTIEEDYLYTKIKTQIGEDDNDLLSLSFLLNILDGTLSPENIVFIMTTNHKEVLDPALFRPGRMDLDVKIEKCCAYQLKQIYYDMYGEELSQSIIDRFKENHFITAEVIMHLFHNIYNKELSQEELLNKFISV